MVMQSRSSPNGRTRYAGGGVAQGGWSRERSAPNPTSIPHPTPTHLLLVDAETIGDGHEVFGAEAALGVDVHGLALAAALLGGQLASHAERVAELRLARPELAKDLREGEGQGRRRRGAATFE